jgi:site-specific recombinase XerD
MFSFAVAEGYCFSNPVAKVALYAVPEKTPAILSIAQAARLITVAAETESTLGLLGYITLGLFAGLRRTEIERLDWMAFKAERRMVTVDGSIAKTGSIRNVALPENALAWLRVCASRSGKVAPLNLNHRLRRLRFLAGIQNWQGNELRHSFASYHFDLHQNAPLTAAQLGHSSGCQLLFEHYRSLVPLGDGLKYFGIHPAPPNQLFELKPCLAE